MPRVVITHETPREEALKLFREMMRNLDPEESLREVLDELRALEQKYGMSTLEFYARYRAGQMGDAEEFMYWAFLYRAFVHLTESEPLVEKAAA